MTTSKPIVVLGAGIAGISAALEAAEAGQEVVLVERDSAVGGRVAKLHRYFPKLCPPSCGLEIDTRRLEKNPRIRVLTRTDLVAAERTDTGWKVTLREEPAWVKPSCTACGECAKVCPTSVPDPFNFGLAKVPAIRIPHLDAWPRRYAMDRAACPADCHQCVEACPAKAVDLSAKERRIDLDAGALVIATGWVPYPLEKLPELGGGVLADVVSNVVLERLASPSGPTGGRILRPSDGRPPRSVVFVQCAGSRDVNHLPYCSSVCCLASLKQTLYLREALPETSVTVCYIDRRAPGRNESMLSKAESAGVKFVKGKVGSVTCAGDGTLRLKLEDQEAGRLTELEADLVVLATGMRPASGELPLHVPRDEDGFALEDRASRLFAAGVAKRPEDVASCVRDATGAAAKAMAAARSH